MLLGDFKESEQLISDAVDQELCLFAWRGRNSNPAMLAASHELAASIDVFFSSLFPTTCIGYSYSRLLPQKSLLMQAQLLPRAFEPEFAMWVGDSEYHMQVGGMSFVPPSPGALFLA